MSLNIKSEEAQRLVRELADITGESQTAAVTQAVRERLDRIRAQRKKPLAERILELGRDCAAHLDERTLNLDMDEFLYGPDGLPK
jgi:antitoxin VapB